MGAHTGEEGDNYAIRGTIENTSSRRTVDYHLLLNGNEISSGSVEFGKSANIISQMERLKYLILFSKPFKFLYMLKYKNYKNDLWIY